MTDIVERLLNWLNQSQKEQHETAIEAADEIERLREENERLRTALEFAAEWGVDSDVGYKNPVSAALRHWIKGGMYGPLTTEQKEMRDE